MSEQELARDLGFLEAYTLGLGTMIGAGIFVLPGIVAEAAGPASMVSFTIGGIVALLAALSLSELATGMPRAGGSYYYINHALGSFFGTIVGWGMWAGLMFATAFYMLGFGQYLLDQPSTAIGVVVAAVVMAALLTLLNYRGVKETGSFQNYIVIALVGLILVFILIGLPQIDTGLLQPFTAGQGWAAVGGNCGDSVRDVHRVRSDRNQRGGDQKSRTKSSVGDGGGGRHTDASVRPRDARQYGRPSGARTCYV